MTPRTAAAGIVASILGLVALFTGSGVVDVIGWALLAIGLLTVAVAGLRGVTPKDPVAARGAAEARTDGTVDAEQRGAATTRFPNVIGGGG